jgi:hypothetical protein
MTRRAELLARKTRLAEFIRAGIVKTSTSDDERETFLALVDLAEIVIDTAIDVAHPVPGAAAAADGLGSEVSDLAAHFTGGQHDIGKLAQALIEYQRAGGRITPEPAV